MHSIKRIAFQLTLTLLATLAFQPTVRAQQKDFYDIGTLQSVSFDFKQANWAAQLAANYLSQTYIRCDVTINGSVFKDAGVRYRGNSSYRKIPKTSQKQAYKVKLDAFVPNAKYQTYATLNFNNNFMDGTWVRETLGYFVYRQFMPAPKSNYVALTINKSSFGPFVNTQQLNKAFLREWFPSDDGNRYKPTDLTANTALTYLGSTPAPYVAAFEIKNNKPTAAWFDLIAMTNTLNNSGANLEVNLPREMDVDNALRMTACDVTMLRLDSYVGSICHNFLIYHDLEHGRFQFMPWDMNNSFGGFTDGAKTLSALANASLYYREVPGPKSLPRPLQSKLLAVPAWRSRYIAHCREISQWLDWAKLKPVIDAFQRVVANAAANDPKRLYPHSHFTSNLTSTSVLTQFKLSIFGIKPVVDARRAYLASLNEFKAPMNTISNLNYSPSKPTTGKPVQFTVKVVAPTAQSVDKVQLYWRIKGVYSKAQMFDDGAHGDGAANDSVFGVSLLSQPAGNFIEYYVESTVKNNAAWNMNFLPATASFKPRRVYIEYKTGGPALRINEVLAINATINKDEAGQFDDWLEIYNTTRLPVNISGMYLTDDRLNPTKWKIPSGQSIMQWGTTLIWCDNDSKDGPLHANFKLSSKGEWLALFDTDGTTLIHQLEIGPQVADISTGRLMDTDVSPLVTLPPTPNVPNFFPFGGIRLYSALDPNSLPMKLKYTGIPKIGTLGTIEISGALPRHFILLSFSAKGAYQHVSEGWTNLLGPTLANPFFRTDATGSTKLRVRIPNLPGLIGLPHYMQAYGIRGLSIVSSNGMEMVVYK